MSRDTGRPWRRHLAVWVAVVVVGAVIGSPSIAAAQQDDPVPPELRQWLDDNDGLRVGWSSVLRPVSVVEDGVVTGGYAVEAWDLAALRLGVDLEHLAYPDAPSLSAALEAGEIDVVGALGSPAVITEGRVASEPYAWVPGVFVGRTDQVPLGVEDLTGRTFTNLPGAAIRAQIEEEHPGGTYVETAGPVVGLRAVAGGEIDLYFGPLALLGHQISRLDLDLVPVGQSEGFNTVQSWADPGTEAAALADLVRASLSDEDLAVLHVLWTGFDLTEPMEGSATPGWLVPASLAVTVLAVVLGLFTIVLRRQVASATSELQTMNTDLEDAIAERTGELQQSNAALTRSNKALSRFASTAAHDLKGPVAAIKGLAGLLRRDLLPEEKRPEVIGQVEASAGRLSTMVNTMLDDALRMGVSADTLTGASFEAWLNEVAGPEIAIVGADLQISVPDIDLDVDPEILRRASLNLISNATKYGTNVDGTRIDVGLTRTGGQWHLTVADNGPGIGTEEWDAVFDRGSRLVVDDRGFGLGLAAIRDLVQGAGGTIRVGDAELGGAEFTVILPTTNG